MCIIAIYGQYTRYIQIINKGDELVRNQPKNKQSQDHNPRNIVIGRLELPIRPPVLHPGQRLAGALQSTSVSPPTRLCRQSVRALRVFLQENQTRGFVHFPKPAPVEPDCQ